jgi:hypothetical protein
MLTNSKAFLLDGIPCLFTNSRRCEFPRSNDLVGDDVPTLKAATKQPHFFFLVGAWPQAVAFAETSSGQENNTLS